MSNDELYKKAQEAITALFSDTSVGFVQEFDLRGRDHAGGPW